jgi:hypothetical protein
MVVGALGQATAGWFCSFPFQLGTTPEGPAADRRAYESPSRTELCEMDSEDILRCSRDAIRDAIKCVKQGKQSESSMEAPFNAGRNARSIPGRMAAELIPRASAWPKPNDPTRWQCQRCRILQAEFDFIVGKPSSTIRNC